MSYLDPRAGHSSGDDTSVPAPYAYGVPGDPGPDQGFGGAEPAWHAGGDVPTGQLPTVEPSRARGRRRAEKELDDVTHRYVAIVDELVKHKEAELLEV